MVRASLAVLGGLTLAALVIAVSSNTAWAQTTLNQTTCVSGPNSCLTNGFLQSINVDCELGQSIANALASITDRNGPNRILISGSCQQSFAVAGFNRLTFEGAPGATITRGWTFTNSRQIVLKSLMFDFNGFPTRMVLNGAHVILEGTTIRESGDPDTAVKLFSDSHLFSSANALNVITENAGNGVDVDGGSLFTAQNITISHNGWRGIYARNGATVALANHVFVNGVLVDTPVDISFNQSNLRPWAPAPSSLVPCLVREEKRSFQEADIQTTPTS